MTNGLYARLIKQDRINIKQLGAFGNWNSHPISDLFETLEEAKLFYPSVSDLSQEIDGLAIQTAINYFDCDIFIPFGAYLINKTITIEKNNIHIVGGNKNYPTLKWNGGENSSSIILLSSKSSRNLFENLSFTTDTDSSDLSSYTTTAIVSNGSTCNNMRNLRFEKLLTGYNLSSNSWLTFFDDCYFVRCNTGINGIGGSANNDIAIRNSQFEYNNIGADLGEGRNQTFYNCDFERSNDWAIRKRNEGDLQIISCYFEDKIQIYYGQTFVRNVLIIGSSFLLDDNRLQCIEYNGSPEFTKICIVACNFNNLSENEETYTKFAIAQTNNAHTVSPTLIDNTYYHIQAVNYANFRGNIIDKGSIENYKNQSLVQNGKNCVSGNSFDLDLEGTRDFRVNLQADEGIYTFILPKIEASKYSYIPTEFTFLIAGNNSNNRLGKFTFGTSNNATIYNNQEFGIENKNKIVKAIYLGVLSSVETWQILII